MDWCGALSTFSLFIYLRNRFGDITTEFAETLGRVLHRSLCVGARSPLTSLTLRFPGVHRSAIVQKQRSGVSSFLSRRQLTTSLAVQLQH
ncbi:unnamed protein product [Victoria cruziana]